MTTTVRDRARTALRRELADAAFDLLTTRGFAETTVEELSHLLGISKATFFRYFDAKEDVVIETAAPAHPDPSVVAEVLTRVPVGGRPAAVLQAVRATLPTPEEQTPRLRARVQMIMTNPSLGARLALRRGRRQTEMTEALAPLLEDPVTAAIWSGIAFACVDIAWRVWASGTEGDLQDCYDNVVRGAQAMLVTAPDGA